MRSSQQTAGHGIFSQAPSPSLSLERTRERIEPNQPRDLVRAKRQGTRGRGVYLNLILYGLKHLKNLKLSVDWTGIEQRAADFRKADSTRGCKEESISLHYLSLQDVVAGVHLSISVAISP